MKKSLLFFLLASMVFSARATYVTFDGTGALNSAAEWGGTLPNGNTTTGLVTTTSNAWTGNAWTDIAVRQTGGYVYAAASDFLMSGGCLYEFEDARTNYTGYTNLYVSGNLQLWSNTETSEINILSGSIRVGSLQMMLNDTIELRDGIFRAGAFSNNPNGRINFLTGGKGRVIIDDMAAKNLGSLYLNFETGTQAEFTISQNSGGPTLATINWMIANGRVSIDGVPATGLSSYVITQNGIETTLSVPGHQGVVRLIVITAN
jgi:hypothetical protein